MDLALATDVELHVLAWPPLEPGSQAGATVDFSLNFIPAVVSMRAGVIYLRRGEELNDDAPLCFSLGRGNYGAGLASWINSCSTSLRRPGMSFATASQTTAVSTSK